MQVVFLEWAEKQFSAGSPSVHFLKSLQLSEMTHSKQSERLTQYILVTSLRWLKCMHSEHSTCPLTQRYTEIQQRPMLKTEFTQHGPRQHEPK